MVSRCPICRGAVSSSAADRPFCSARCKQIDLGRWLGEEYRISRPMTPSELQTAVTPEPGTSESEEASEPS